MTITDPAVHELRKKANSPELLGEECACPRVVRVEQDKAPALQFCTPDPDLRLELDVVGDRVDRAFLRPGPDITSTQSG
jgi:hypothetical protein